MFKEKDFEDIIAKYPELIEEGLIIKGRQITLYGRRMDLLFEDRFKRQLIVEMKRGPIKDEHIGQVMSYEGMLLSADDPTIRIMLIGNRVPPNIQRTLDHHGIAWREITLTRLSEFLTERNDQELLQVLDSCDNQIPRNNRYISNKLRSIPRLLLTSDVSLEANYMQEHNDAGQLVNEHEGVGLDKENSSWDNIDQTKYTLDKIFERQNSTPSTRELTEEFHNLLGRFLNTKHLKWWARTHAYGCSYFSNKTRCFLAINISASEIIVHYYTGNSQIYGLEKSTWSKRMMERVASPFISEVQNILEMFCFLQRQLIRY